MTSVSKEEIARAKLEGPYLADCQGIRAFNVASDGNCGARALCVAAGQDDTLANWIAVRIEIACELRVHRDFYEGLFGESVDGKVAEAQTPMTGWLGGEHFLAYASAKRTGTRRL